MRTVTDALRGGKPGIGQTYLTERGLTPETITEFGLGLCAKVSMAGRIVFPIQNALNRSLSKHNKQSKKTP